MWFVVEVARPSIVIIAPQCLREELHNRLPKKHQYGILKNISLFSVQNTLTHIKSPIIPLLESFCLDDKVELSIEMQYKNIYWNKWTNIALLKNSGPRFLGIEIIPEEIHSKILQHLQLVF